MAAVECQLARQREIVIAGSCVASSAMPVEPGDRIAQHDPQDNGIRQRQAVRGGGGIELPRQFAVGQLWAKNDRSR
jgi:hypothetical protein